MERPSTPLPGDEDQERLSALGYSYPSDENNNTFFYYAIGKPKGKESMNCWQALLYFLIEKGYLLKAAAKAINSTNAYEEPEKFMSLLTDMKKHTDGSNIDPGRVLCFFSPCEGLIHVGLSQGNGKMWSHLSESMNGIQDIDQYMASCEDSEMTKNVKVASYRIKPEFKT
ncbi:hypothetical protein KEC16_04235 [Magnetospirillum sp. J10]|uniref:Uncharacterized protein n=2 Tax=Magnetospirillum sulfuroxidans TaxID=611300 RepID=A0ABS5I8Z8_9PROT|nr:hypothetical protein [Magnetospirillum sulfuroxidans]